MATVKSINRNATPPSDTQPAEDPVAVEGWANSNWQTRKPPVVLRPDASALDLLSWGIGQIEQAEMVMRVMGSSHCDITIEPGEATGPARMLTEQGLIALKAAADKLFKTDCEQLRAEVSRG